MGVVNTTDTFQATDTITSSKLNNIIDQTTFTGDAIQGTTLQVVSPGKLAVNAGGITSNELASSSVVTAKIANEAVITEKISDSAITTIKLANSTSSTTGVTTAKIADSNVTTAKLANASVTAAKLDGNQSGSAPIFGVRAWVNFEGRTTNGNCTIRSSGNVTSVARTAAGKYTVTFATAMQDANYVVNANSGVSPGSPRFACADRSTATVNTVKIETDNLSGSPTDFNENNVMVIR
jgi:hypothetical protein